MFRLARVALLAVLLLVPVAAANAPPVVGPIKAELEPPRTFYTVDAADADGDTLTFTWSTTGQCGGFTSTGARAVWSHQHPPCGDEPFHPGTITVRVSDGHNTDVVRAYAGGSASGTGNTTDDPRDEPIPPVYGEEIECDQNSAEGVFEPTQGVWQDDEDFADAPGKQLSRNPHFPRWVAELPMVQDKPTLLFGVRGSRYEIPYNVTLSGSEVGAARVRFQVVEMSSGRVENVWRWPAQPIELPIYGACGSAATSRYKIPVPTGAPDPAPAFRFRSAGEYRIIAELVDKDDVPIPNTQVQLEGRVVDVPQTKIRLTGVSFTQGVRFPGPDQGPYLVPARPRPDTLDANLERIREEILTFAPDYWPVARGDLDVETDRAPAGLVDMDRILEVCKEQGRIFDPNNASNGQFDCVRSYVREILYTGQLRDSWIANVRYTALVLARESYFLAMTAEGKASAGEAIGPKLAIIMEGMGHLAAMHEFSHISPYVWKAEGECGRKFHNNDVTVANGFRIEVGGVEHRMKREHIRGLMTAAGASTDRFTLNGTLREIPQVWIEQCTYENVLRFLPTPSDPPLQALVLRFLRVPGNESAAIVDGLTMDGVPDTMPGGEGTHAVVLRDAAGTEIRRFGFTPRFDTDESPSTPLALVAMRFERPAEAAKLEVVGPNGTLVARELGAPPRVTIEAPVLREGSTFENGTVVLSYAAEGARDFSVYASADQGKTWRTLVPRTNATLVHIDAANFAPGTTEILRVLASDGIQSGEATATFAMPAAPAAGAGVPGIPLGVLLASILVIGLLRRRPKRFP